MTFISYAQNFEDVMLWRALKSVECGFYIDVGANDPDIDSVTKAFYDRGWRGINIEPVAQWHEKLQEKRVRDINLQLAVGAEKGELVLYELPDTGLSTIIKTTAERHEAKHGYTKIERTVLVETLTSICQRFHVAPIHFLKIDVEGAEKDVLDGLDLSVIRPWIILVESTFPDTQVEDYAQWDPLIRAANYNYVYYDGLNRFYVAQEHEDLEAHFHAPPNVFDLFMLSGLASQPFYRLVESKAKEQERRALAAESRAEEQERRALAAESRAEEQERRALAAESRAQEQERRAVAAESRAQEQERRAVAAENHAEEQEWLAQADENRVEEQQKRIDELGGNSHHWWLQATAAEAREKALRQSLSWKITAPLRLGLDAVYVLMGRKKPPFLPRTAVGKPALVAGVHRSLRPFPRLYAYVTQKVDRIVQTPSQYLVVTGIGVDNAFDLSRLTPSAQRIHAELKAAIEKNRDAR